MLASSPVGSLNQIRAIMGIPHRFNLSGKRSRKRDRKYANYEVNALRARYYRYRRRVKEAPLDVAWDALIGDKLFK